MKKKKSDSLSYSQGLGDLDLALKVQGGIDVYSQAKSINTAAKSTGKGSARGNCERVISEKFQARKYPIMTCSALASLVKVFPLRENVKVFKTSQGELFSLKSVESCEIKDQKIYSLRMLRGYFLTTTAEPSQLYSFHWMNLGMMQNGLSQTLNITYRKTGKGSLSLVLEDEVDEKYYLSEKMMEFLTNKAASSFKGRFKGGLTGKDQATCIKNTYHKMDKTDPYIIQKTGGQTVTVKQGETGCLQAGGANVRDKVPNVIGPCIRAEHHNTADVHFIPDQSRIRRLTPRECERLQGFPDDWTEGVSDTQRYKMCGNAVSVPVIKAIGKKILKSIREK